MSDDDIINVLNQAFPGHLDTVGELVQGLAALRAAGYEIVTKERIAQLEASYYKMRDKYYEADEALYRVKRTMQAVLYGNVEWESMVPEDESSTELHDSG